jgi:hypothetical protein
MSCSHFACLPDVHLYVSGNKISFQIVPPALGLRPCISIDQIKLMFYGFLVTQVSGLELYLIPNLWHVYEETLGPKVWN